MSINAYVGKISSPFLAGIEEPFSAKYTQLYHTLHSLVNPWIVTINTYGPSLPHRPPRVITKC